MRGARNTSAVSRRSTRRAGGTPGGAPARSSAEEVGAVLAAERASRGIDLSSVQDRTGVARRLLEDLERGDLSAFASRTELAGALRRYAELLGLDPAPLWAQLLTTASQGMPNVTDPSAAGSRSNAVLPAIAAMATAPVPGKATALADDPFLSTTRSRLGAFTQTAPVPVVARPAAAGSRRSAEASRRRAARANAPAGLRAAVWLAVLALAVASAALGVEHWRPRWLRPISAHSLASFVDGITGATGSHSPAQQAGPGGVNHSNGSGRTSQPTTRPQGTSLVTSSTTGSASSTVSVRTGSFTVVFAAFAPCWLQVTSSTGKSQLFAGIVAGGQQKRFGVGAGAELTMKLGASHVLVSLLVRGKLVKGWLFAPPVAPFTLHIRSVPA